MNCSRCGRVLTQGETICLNCGEPSLSAIKPKIREKPSDIITCLVIGLFALFGVPALLFGGYLVAVGLGYFTSDNLRSGSEWIALVVSIIPLAVFFTLAYFLIRVKIARNNGN